MEDQLFQAIGGNIKTCRKKAGFNQSMLSSRAGLSRTSLVNIEQGKQHPSIFMLWKIAEALDVEIKELLPSRSQVPTALREVKRSDNVGLPQDDQNLNKFRQYIQEPPNESTKS